MQQEPKEGYQLYIVILDKDEQEYKKAKQLLELTSIKHKEYKGHHGSNTYKIMNQEQTKVVGFLLQPLDDHCPKCESKLVEMQLCLTCSLEKKIDGRGQ